MKCIRFIVTALFLLLFIFVSASAQDESFKEIYDSQLESSGAAELWNGLPEDTRTMLEGWGINDIEPSGLTALTPGNVLKSLAGMMSGQSGRPLRSMAVLLGVVLLFAIVSAMKETVKEQSISGVFGAVCGLVACAALMIPISDCMQRVCAAAQSVSVFMTSFVSVYAGVMIVSGQVASAASYQTFVLFAAELVSFVATTLIIPLMSVSLALGLTGSVAPECRLGAAGDMINKTCGWVLGLSATLFSGLLSMQSIVSGAADSLTGRAVKFSVSSFLPVVGGAMGEAFSTVQGCLTLLKSTLGGIGILVTALIVLPPIVECVIWLFSLGICCMVADMFGLEPLSAAFKAARGVFRILIAVLSICAVLMIVATAIMSKSVSA